MRTTGRDLVVVIDKIIEVVPPSEKQLIHDLTSCQSSAQFAAPEMQSEVWARTANVLASAVGIPSKPWHHQVATIFTGTAPS